MFGLSINLHQWNHLIAKIVFDCTTDHLAAVQIMHGKDEPKGRIGKILDKIFEYTFCLYYVKGKDLILTDYFSRVPADQHQVDEVIPISFINLCRPDELTMFGMMMRRWAQAAGVSVPKVHGVDKGVDPHVKPEHQKPHPQPEQKRRLTPAAPLLKRNSLPQPRPQANDQHLTRKLVERSRAVLNRCETTKCLPRDQTAIHHPPLPVPIPPERVWESDTPVHVSPFLSPNPAFHKPKAMNEIDAEYNPLMDTDSPYDDALVEIEYRHPVDDDFTLPLVWRNKLTRVNWQNVTYHAKRRSIALCIA